VLRPGAEHRQNDDVPENEADIGDQQAATADAGERVKGGRGKHRVGVRVEIGELGVAADFLDERGQCLGVLADECLGVGKRVRRLVVAAFVRKQAANSSAAQLAQEAGVFARVQGLEAAIDLVLENIERARR